jgi:Na+/glutamate symporter
MTALAFVLIVYFVVVGILSLIGLDPHYGAPIAAAIAIVPGFSAARPFAIVFFPESLERADENSRRRLRGSGA